MAVAIPVGPSNRFSPRPRDRGQTTLFPPGRTRDAFAVVFDGRDLKWRLKGPDGRSRTATASSRSRRCATPAGPTARDDQATTYESVPVTIDVLANDTDPQGDPLTVSSVGAPSHGAAVLEPSGAVTYTPEMGFVGADAFSYAISDGHGGTAGATVHVTVNPPASTLPRLSVEDASVGEGQDGLRTATLTLRLSRAWDTPVGVDYATVDGTALSGCDYRTGFGAVSFPPGETSATLAVAVVGDLAPEADETFAVVLGNPVQAVLARDRATVTIRDDDGQNQPPAAPGERVPAFGGTSSRTPVLSRSSVDPDPGDAVTYDVFVGTAFGTGGHAWRAECPEGPSPGPRAGAAAAYDADGDRLFLIGGEAGATLGDAWVMDRASGASGPPSWASVALAGGPGARAFASAVHDPGSGRVVVHGGCATAECTSVLADTWLLDGVGGASPPSWLPLPDAPVARAGHVSAFVPAARRMIVFGGRSDGADLADVWALDLAGGGSWRPLQPEGTPPSPRRDSAGAYDPAGDRLFVFGGRETGGAAFGDLWVLEHASGLGKTPRWTQVPAAGPAPRWGAVAAWDPASRRLLVHGGSTAGFETDENFVFGDAWMLDGTFGAQPAWLRVFAGDETPPGRFLAAAGYSGSANRFVLFGGRNNETASHLGDAWVMTGAMGSLPLVSAGQAEPFYAPAPSWPAGRTTGGWRPGTPAAPCRGRRRGPSAPSRPVSRSGTRRWCPRRRARSRPRST